MRSSSDVARSSRGRTIKPTPAAIAVAISRRRKGNGARGTGRGRPVASAPRGGRGAAIGQRGRGTATAPRAGREAALLGPRGVRRLEFESEEAHECDGAENNDEYDGTEDDGVEFEEEAEVQLDANEEEDGEQETLYLRGPATLPPLPANDHEKSILEPTGDL
jgi:ribosomal protein L15